MVGFGESRIQNFRIHSCVKINRLSDRKSHAARSFRFSPNCSQLQEKPDGFPTKPFRSLPRVTGGNWPALGIRSGSVVLVLGVPATYRESIDEFASVLPL